MLQSVIPWITAYGSNMEDCEKQRNISLVSEVQNNGDSLYDACSATYCYDAISDNNEKEVYQELSKLLKECYEGEIIPNQSATISNISLKGRCDYTRAEELLQAVLYDHPMIFFMPVLSGAWSTTASLEIHEDFSGQNAGNLPVYKETLEKAVKKMAAEAAERETDAEKAAVIEKYICDRATLRCEIAPSYDDVELKPTPYSECAAGLILDGYLTPKGYARLFQAGTTYAGFKCFVQAGDALQGSIYSSYTDKPGHAWNVISLDGKLYTMDLAWDDFGTFGYKYFGEGIVAYKKKKPTDDYLYKGFSISNEDHPFRNSFTGLSTEERGDFRILYYHVAPYFPKYGAWYSSSGFNISVSYTNKWDEIEDYSAFKIKANKKLNTVQVTRLLYGNKAGKKASKEIKSLTAKEKGLPFQVVPRYIHEEAGYKERNYGKTHNVKVKWKNGSPRTVRVKIEGTDKLYVKLNPTEWSYDPETQILSFSGDRFRGSYKLIRE